MNNAELIAEARAMVQEWHRFSTTGRTVKQLADALEAAEARIAEIEALFPHASTWKALIGQIKRQQDSGYPFADKEQRG